MEFRNYENAAGRLSPMAQMHHNRALDTASMVIRPDLLHIADRLTELAAGSRRMDCSIHEALELDGVAPRYTTDPAALRSLLPPGATAELGTYSTGRVYGVCRVPDHGHFGQMGATEALALLAAVLRARAMLG